jgi:N-acetylmuramoyl-L-alanine amidase
MKVAIDPGHGLGNRTPGVFDSGATHREGDTTFQEADITLQYGLELRQALASRHLSNFMTRADRNDAAPVVQRASRARDEGCDVFVSFHLNDAEDDTAHGLEVLFRSDTKDKALASKLQQALVDLTGLRDRRIKKRTDLAVLKFQPGPAVLIELGFIANDDDRNTLLNADVRSSICNTIVDVLTSST